MKQLQYLLICFTCCFSISAQTQSIEVDSLKKVIISGETVTERLQSVIQVVSKAMYDSEDTVLKYINYGLELTEGDDNLATQVYIPELLKLRASAKLVRRSFVESIGIYRDATIAYENVLDQYIRLENFEEIEEYWSLRKGLASVNNNIGLIFFFQGKYDSTITYYLKAIELSENIITAPFEEVASRAKTDIATTLDNLSIIYKDRNEFETALEYNLESERLLKEVANERALSGVLVNQGNYYTRLKMFDKAIEVFEESLLLSKKMELNYHINMALHGLGYAYEEKAVYKKALAPLLQSRDYWIAQNNLDMLISNGATLAGCYLGLKQYDMAIELTSSLPMQTDSLGIPDRKLDILRFEIDFYAQIASELNLTDFYEKAINSSRLMEQLKDSLYTLEKDKQFDELQTAYETEKKQRLIDQQQAALVQEATVRNALIGGAVLLLIIAGLIINRQQLSIRSKAKEKELTELKLAKTKDELELREQELLTYVISISQKNNLLHNVKEKAQKGDDLTEANKRLKKINHEIENGYNLNQQWEEFREKFEKIHQRFFNRLAEIASDLTNTDRRICAYLKLGLSSKQISNLQNVSVESVEVRRSQIRKKLQLSKEDNLSSYIQNLS